LGLQNKFETKNIWLVGLLGFDMPEKEIVISPNKNNTPWMGGECHGSKNGVRGDVAGVAITTIELCLYQDATINL